MRLECERGFLELERSGLGEPATPSDEDVLLNVTVQASSYSAADQIWMVKSDWDRFLGELRTLEKRRQGRAVLEGASPQDLRLEFFSTDSAGHMAVQGQVRRMTNERFDLQLQFGFAFEPDELPRLLRELEGFTQR